MYAMLGLLVVALWVPRFQGPIDLRWDGGVYYVLGTSLAEGKGYRLLNEPGEIEAIQYPPLLPLIVAAHQKILGTSDPLVVGHMLRLSFFVIFFAYIITTFMVLKRCLPLKFAFVGTIIGLFHTNTYFMSDLLFPEILFGLATTSFVLLNLRTNKPSFAVATVLLGMAAFSLRTIGIALLVAWVAEGLLNKNVKVALIRAGLTLLPVFCWQAYIASVVAGPEYLHPAYDYQRAEYMFYNVSYAKNIFTFKDPFTPELGVASVNDIAARFIFNIGQIPQSLGEAVSSRRIAYEVPWKFFEIPFPFSTPWPVDVFLFALGSLVLLGIAVQLKQGQYLVPLYVLLSIAGICLTPWSQQFSRYLMPLTPFLVLFLLTALLFTKDMLNRLDRWKKVGSKFLGLIVCLILIQHVLTVAGIYTRRHQNVTYRVPTGGSINYKLFYYLDANRALDGGLDWLLEHAKYPEVLAGSMPHWMHLRTGLKTVMPPFETDPVKAQAMLDSVPVSYLLQDEGLAIDTKRYIEEVIKRFPDRWDRVYFDTIVSEDQGDSSLKFAIYRRVGLPHPDTKDSIGSM